MGIRTSHRRTAVAALALVLALLLPTAATPAGGEEEQASDLSYDEYLEKVKKLKKKYERAEPPAEPPKLRWDFSRERTLSYFRSQNTRSWTDIKRHADPPGRKVTFGSAIVVKSEGDGKASVAVKNRMAKITELGKDGEKIATTRHMMPRVVIPKMEEDSSTEKDHYVAETITNGAFGLPSEPLEVGESVRKPISAKVAGIGSMLTIKEHMFLTLARYVYIDGQRCAQLNGRIHFTELVEPEDGEGEYEVMTSRGKSVGYFSLEEGKYLYVCTASALKIRVKDRIPETGAEHAKGDPGDRISLTRKIKSRSSYQPVHDGSFTRRLEKIKKQ